MSHLFGICIANLRKKRGRSQKYVAIEAGLDPSYLAGLERGRRSPPRKKLLTRLLNALEATPSERLEVRRAIAATQISRMMDELDPSYSQSLTRLASGMRFCTADELKALEVIVQGFERRAEIT